jgi:hypothetical protein
MDEEQKTRGGIIIHLQPRKSRWRARSSPSEKVLAEDGS